MIPVLELGEIDSTSREAARRAARGERGPLWLHGTAQTAGRGRSGRSWLSPPGNLYATLLRPCDGPVSEAALRSFVAALALAEVLDALVGAPERVALKWPNDVLLDGRKVAGILLESGGGEHDRWLSIGIGLNLAHAPDDPARPAISLAAALGDAPAVPVALDLLRSAYEAQEACFVAEGFAAIRRRWLARAARLGETIEARLPRETLTGRFDGIAGDGSLLLDTAAGLRHIPAADVHFPTLQATV